MKRFAPQLLPIAPFGLPCLDPDEAWRLLSKYTPELPGWPRLPRRSFLEDPVLQLSERFPGAVFEGSQIYVDAAWETDSGVDDLYIAYLGNYLDQGRMSAQYAAGLDGLARQTLHLPAQAMLLKGQIVGPLSWSERVLDKDGRPILYDELLLDVAAKHLRMKAAWQESVLREHGVPSLIVLEEPLLAADGLAGLPLDDQRCVALVEEVLGGVSGWRGIHCTWPMDATVLTAMSVNVLSLDVSKAEPVDPEGASALALRSFLAKGGTIAWAIVPADGSADEDQATAMTERLDAWLRYAAGADQPVNAVAAVSMVGVSSGLELIGVEDAERALALAREISAVARAKYI